MLLHRLQARIVKGLYRASNLFLKVLSRVLWPRRRPTTARRVCIYRIGQVGDLI